MGAANSILYLLIKGCEIMEMFMVFHPDTLFLAAVGPRPSIKSVYDCRLSGVKCLRIESRENLFSEFPTRSDTYRAEESALAWWLERRTPDRETRVRSSIGSVCCFLEQETFTPQKYW